MDKEVDNAKQEGIDVSVAVSKTAPEYKSLKRLEGHDLLDAILALAMSGLVALSGLIYQRKHL